MIPPLNVRHLVRTYSVANTPIYLYRHFVGDESVRALGRNATADELVELFNDRVRKESRSIEDIAVAYSVVAALTLRDYQDVLTMLPRLRLELLDWASDILRYWDETRVSSSTASHRVPPFTEPLRQSLGANSLIEIVQPPRRQRGTDVSSPAANVVMTLKGSAADD